MAKPQEVIVANRLVNTYNSASRRSKEFNLSLKYLTNVVTQTHCAYSGEPFNDNKESEKLSLERFNNSLGYIEGNVIPVKQKYNKARSDFELHELIQKRDEIAGRIVRAVDAKEAEVNIESLSKGTRKTIARIQANIEKRKAHLNQKGINEEMKKALTARIIGGEAEIKRLMSVSNVMKAPKASKAEETVHSYDIVIKGLSRFENLSWLDKKKIMKGLPLSANMIQLIRGKM
ncbi:Srd anti-sigma factor [Serratia phage CHI14]|uniref:Putative antisigma factor n=2 Tax=Winklervirus chi14 TaxID=2560752 RepID=A0A1Z1LY18_9CAUD|nr:Srd anti-sigma factor [Serratia phage CHI14]ARW57441.1 putative antisigma factor [Serratia phage CHI14]ARW57716.1 putative antisigma factor [Serratia phage CBH8]UYM28671.1 putative anti-sigma factor [Serratia phage vB_SspM_LC53]